MTTPRVVELPRRLEPISRDTFLGAGEAEAPLAVVVALRPRGALGSRRAARARGARQLRAVPLRAVADPGPGDHAA
jgi:hypothetical protein